MLDVQPEPQQDDEIIVEEEWNPDRQPSAEPGPSKSAPADAPKKLIKRAASSDIVVEVEVRIFILMSPLARI